MAMIAGKIRLIATMALSSLLLACVPTIQTVYLTPQVQGKVVLFTPGESTNFSPLSGITAYHPSSPEAATQSNQQGEFLLEASSTVEASLLMPGHSLNYYPVTVQTETFSYTVLAQASTKMLDLETVKLSSVVVSDELEGKQLLADSGPNALKYCNLNSVKQLRREQAVHQLIKQYYPAPERLEQPVLSYIKDQQQQTLMWLEYVKRSCNWEDEDGYPRYRDMKDAREYFAKLETSLLN
ncbi:hypothetical protein [Agarivorans aestuarii]|uniref:hypothetical protein n=1 Tax=Agarivorans aestuarii TaxID=1563703 RepID=UPI001C8055D3|nr:hypothetical protein [Agarivorans aestuarii]